MKVVALKNYSFYEGNKSITKGKVYTVILHHETIGHNLYDLLDDSGHINRYSCILFESIDCYRDRKIEKLLK
jgi:hypothetical protein